MIQVMRMGFHRMETWLTTEIRTIWSEYFKEFMEAFAVLFNVGCILVGSTVIPLLMLYILFCTQFWFLVALYITWIYVDRKTGFNGGRKIRWLRNLKIFNYYRDYFPIRLIKTVDLPPDKNYLFVMYPHGIIGYSILANFGSNANHFDDLYPGLDTRQITLDSNFYAPISREYILSLGGCGASETSILSLLNGKPSKAVILVAGGASEALLAYPGTYRIILNKRKGFVRLALKSGSPLVPVFSFGENDNHYQYNSKLWSQFQQVCHRCTRIVPIIPKPGIPYRRPINTVVGSPIHVPKIENPSQEDIDEYHERYKTELRKLFERYKHEYDAMNGEKAELIIL